MVRVVVVFLAAILTAGGASAAGWPTPGQPQLFQPGGPSTCDTFKWLLSMAQAGRETANSPPFGKAYAPLRDSSAAICKASSTPERSRVVCDKQHANDGDASVTLMLWSIAASSCLPGWQRESVDGSDISFTQPSGGLTLNMRELAGVLGHAVEVSATSAPCGPIEHMKSAARSGRRPGGNALFPKNGMTLSMRYFDTDRCTGRAGDTAGSFVVACTAATPAADMPAKMGVGRKIAEACLANWTHSPVPGGDLYRDASGYAALMSARDGTTFELAMSFTPSAAAPAKSTTPTPAAATTPAIPQAPAQSACTPYNDLFLMAKIGSEGGKSAPFTTTPRTLAHAYLGAQKCVGAKAETGHTITCTAAAGDSASAQRMIDAQDKGMAACRGDWFRVQRKTDDVFFMMPTDRATFRIEKADGTNVRTTMTYDTCKPLDSLLFSTGVGQWFDTSGKQTGAAARLRMKYFGGTCSASPAQGARSNVISCAFPDLEGAQARRTALDIVQTTKTCRPDWAFKDNSDSWLFESKNGFQMIVEAREGRPAAFMVQKKSAAK